MSEKVLTPEERRWVNRLARCIKEMPRNLELVAYDGSITVCEDGSLRSFLDTGENFGTAEYLENIKHKRIHTHGESA